MTSSSPSSPLCSVMLHVALRAWAEAGQVTEEVLSQSHHLWTGEGDNVRECHCPSVSTVLLDFRYMHVYISLFSPFDLYFLFNLIPDALPNPTSFVCPRLFESLFY